MKNILKLHKAINNFFCCKAKEDQVQKEVPLSYEQVANKIVSTILKSYNNIKIEQPVEETIHIWQYANTSPRLIASKYNESLFLFESNPLAIKWCIYTRGDDLCRAGFKNELSEVITPEVMLKILDDIKKY